MDLRSSVIIFLAFVSENVVISHVVNYGPSIEFLTRNWDNEGKKNISLINFSPTYSVLIPLVENRASVNYTDATKYFKYFHYGEFDVFAPEHYGIVAVIQQLRLRKVFGQSDRCLDYISFKDNESNETKVPKICGEVDPDEDFIESPKKMIGSIRFVAPSGNLTVRISLVSVVIKSEWITRSGTTIEPTIATEISFTAFPLSSDVVTNQNSDTTDETTSDLPLIFHGCPNSSLYHPGHYALRRCSAFVKDSCIHESLFCDDIVQCGFDIFGFAQDEQDCGKYRNEFDESRKDWIQYYVSHSSNVFNGTRKEKPQLIVTNKPIEIEVIEDLITVLGCLIGVALFLGVIWWFYQVFTRRNVEPVSDTIDMKRQSIIQMLRKQ